MWLWKGPAELGTMRASKFLAAIRRTIQEHSCKIFWYSAPARLVR